MGDNNSISGVEPIEPDKVPPLPGADQESGAGMGGVFSKVYLLRPKIKCNSPHSRPGDFYLRLRSSTRRGSSGMGAKE